MTFLKSTIHIITLTGNGFHAAQKKLNGPANHHGYRAYLIRS